MLLFPKIILKYGLCSSPLVFCSRNIPQTLSVVELQTLGLLWMVQILLVTAISCGFNTCSECGDTFTFTCCPVKYTYRPNLDLLL